VPRAVAFFNNSEGKRSTKLDESWVGQIRVEVVSIPLPSGHKRPGGRDKRKHIL
jgi:hypothetical protein